MNLRYILLLAVAYLCVTLKQPKQIWSTDKVCLANVVCRHIIMIVLWINSKSKWTSNQSSFLLPRVSSPHNKALRTPWATERHADGFCDCGWWRWWVSGLSLLVNVLRLNHTFVQGTVLGCIINKRFFLLSKTYESIMIFSPVILGLFPDLMF